MLVSAHCLSFVNLAMDLDVEEVSVVAQALSLLKEFDAKAAEAAMSLYDVLGRHSRRSLAILCRGIGMHSFT